MNAKEMHPLPAPSNNGGLGVIEPNGWWLGEVPPCTNVEL